MTKQSLIRLKFQAVSDCDYINLHQQVFVGEQNLQFESEGQNTGGIHSDHIRLNLTLHANSTAKQLLK